MRFHGLFIGVDRFKSEREPWLTCARRDAEALHALFVDTLGGDAAVLLTDEDATRTAVVERTRLAEKTESLLVQLEFGVPATMVAVARHAGTQLNRGHYLALGRAEITSLDTISRMSADKLTELLGQVPPILQQLLATPPSEEGASNG